MLASPALRFSAYFAAVFLALGVYLPFWPLWLEDRGLSAGEIGLVLAVASWARVIGTPLVGRISDRSGRPQATMLVAAVLGLGFFALFFGISGFWPILLLHLAWALAFNPLIPLGESRAMAAVQAQDLDFGRMRLWGSLAFILGSLAAGEAVAWRGPTAILVLVLVALLATVLTVASLPRVELSRPSEFQSAGLRSLLADRRFLLFLVAASLLQGSHAAYYGFSALHWSAAGLGEATIGWLWAEGVIAEILLFIVAGRLVARLGPGWLLVLAGCGGLVRWLVLAATTDPLLLVPAQALHALTFGAAHLGIVYFISARAPDGLKATAQSLYAAVSGGLVMGASLWLAGRLYSLEPSSAFLAMAALAASGLIGALLLTRAGDDGR